MSLNIASDPLNEMDYMSNGLLSSTIQLSHLKKIHNAKYDI